MKHLLIYLRPKAPMSSWVSAETLFGAICWSIRHLYGKEELANWLERFRSDEPALLISSAFPFAERDGQIFHFFPKPLTLNPDAEVVAQVAGKDKATILTAIQKAKEIDKSNFLSETLFAKAVKGQLNSAQLLQSHLDNQTTRLGACLMPRKEESMLSKPIWEKTDVQHTAVDRVLLSAAEGLLFFEAQFSFAEGCGLFCFLRCPDDFPLEPVSRFLRHSGIGGNRSVGKGHFDIQSKPADEMLKSLSAPNGSSVLLLSPCIPKEGEFDFSNSVYQLTTERPRFESGYSQPERVHKGILRCISEGSVMKPTQLKAAYGQLVEVGKQTDFEGTHPVFHYGLGFPLQVVMSQ